MDSYMFQTVGHDAIEWLATCFGLPLIRKELKRDSKAIGNDYVVTDDDEVEDLFELLLDVKVCSFQWG
jgi:diphthine-ammonia ligase